MKVPRFRDHLARYALGFRLAITTAVRFALGRWYVFRDCPDWFVQAVANNELEEGDPPEAVGYHDQARQEWALRKHRRNKARNT